MVQRRDPPAVRSPIVGDGRRHDPPMTTSSGVVKRAVGGTPEALRSGSMSPSLDPLVVGKRNSGMDPLQSPVHSPMVGSFLEEQLRRTPPSFTLPNNRSGRTTPQTTHTSFPRSEDCTRDDDDDEEEEDDDDDEESEEGPPPPPLVMLMPGSPPKSDLHALSGSVDSVLSSPERKPSESYHFSSAGKSFQQQHLPPKIKTSLSGATSRSKAIEKLLAKENEPERKPSEEIMSPKTRLSKKIFIENMPPAPASTSSVANTTVPTAYAAATPVSSATPNRTTYLTRKAHQFSSIKKKRNTNLLQKLFCAPSSNVCADQNDTVPTPKNDSLIPLKRTDPLQLALADSDEREEEDELMRIRRKRQEKAQLLQLQQEAYQPPQQEQQYQSSSTPPRVRIQHTSAQIVPSSNDTASGSIVAATAEDGGWETASGCLSISEALERAKDTFRLTAEADVRQSIQAAVDGALAAVRPKPPPAPPTYVLPPTGAESVNGSELTNPTTYMTHTLHSQQLKQQKRLERSTVHQPSPISTNAGGTNFGAPPSARVPARVPVPGAPTPASAVTMTPIHGRLTPLETNPNANFRLNAIPTSSSELPPSSTMESSIRDEMLEDVFEPRPSEHTILVDATPGEQRSMDNGIDDFADEKKEEIQTTSVLRNAPPPIQTIEQQGSVSPTVNASDNMPSWRRKALEAARRANFSSPTNGAPPTNPHSKTPQTNNSSNPKSLFGYWENMTSSNRLNGSQRKPAGSVTGDTTVSSTTTMMILVDAGTSQDHNGEDMTLASETREAMEEQSVEMEHEHYQVRMSPDDDLVGEARQSDDPDDHEGTTNEICSDFDILTAPSDEPLDGRSSEKEQGPTSSSLSTGEEEEEAFLPNSVANPSTYDENELQRRVDEALLLAKLGWDDGEQQRKIEEERESWAREKETLLKQVEEEREKGEENLQKKTAEFEQEKAEILKEKEALEAGAKCSGETDENSSEVPRAVFKAREELSLQLKAEHEVELKLMKVKFERKISEQKDQISLSNRQIKSGEDEVARLEKLLKEKEESSPENRSDEHQAELEELRETLEARTVEIEELKKKLEEKTEEASRVQAIAAQFESVQQEIASHKDELQAAVEAERERTERAQAELDAKNLEIVRMEDEFQSKSKVAKQEEFKRLKEKEEQIADLQAELDLAKEQGPGNSALTADLEVERQRIAEKEKLLEEREKELMAREEKLSAAKMEFEARKSENQAATPVRAETPTRRSRIPKLEPGSSIKSPILIPDTTSSHRPRKMSFSGSHDNEKESLRKQIAQLEKQTSEANREHERTLEEIRKSNEEEIAQIKEDMRKRLEEHMNRECELKYSLEQVDSWEKQDLLTEIEELKTTMESERSESLKEVQKKEELLETIAALERKEQDLIDTHERTLEELRDSTTAEINRLQEEMERLQTAKWGDVSDPSSFDKGELLEKIQNLENELEKEKTEATAAKEKLDELEKRSMSLEAAHLEELAEKQMKANIEIKDLRMDLAEKEDTIETLTKEKDDALERLRDIEKLLETEQMERVEKLEEFRADHSRLVEQLKRESNAKIEELTKESNEKLEQAQKEHAGQLSVLETQLTETKERLEFEECNKQGEAELAEKLTDIEKIKEGMENQIQILNKELEAQKSEYEEKIKDVADGHAKELEELISQLDLVEEEHKQKLMQKEQTAEQKDGIITALSAQLADAHARLKGLEETSHKLESLQWEGKKAQENVELLTRELQTIKAAHDKYIAETDKMREKACDEAREEMIERAEVQFRQANELYVKLKKQYDASKAKVEKLTNELTAAKAKADELSKDKSKQGDLRGELEKLRTANAKYEAESAQKSKDFQREMENLLKAAEDFESKYKEADIKAKAVQKTLTAVLAEKTELKQSFDALSGEHDEMKQVCEELMAELEGRNPE